MRLLAEIAVTCTLLSVISAQKYPYGEVSLIVKLWSDPPASKNILNSPNYCERWLKSRSCSMRQSALGPFQKTTGVLLAFYVLRYRCAYKWCVCHFLKGTMAGEQWNEWWRKYSLLSFSCNACKLRLKSSKSSLAWWILSGTRGLPRCRGPRKVWISYGFNDGQSS